MPELPEVEITRRGLAPDLCQRTVTELTVRQPRLRYPVPEALATHIVGQPLIDVRRRAKYLLFDFSAGSMLVHLGMSGSLRVHPASLAAGKHDHVDVIFGDRLLRLRDPRRFGAVLWTDSPETHPLLTGLGIEPLEAGFDGPWLHRQTRQRNTPIKLWLMDASQVVGVGNIYASESLFRAGIHPRTPARRLSAARCERLASAVRETLEDALRAGGSSLRDFVHSDGASGYFQQAHAVYGREGSPCLRCKAEIRRAVMGQRATFWCPTCQKT